ncbi:MAG: hypothetical protein Q9178_006600 [Gyalolechia marmorata]
MAKFSISAKGGYFLKQDVSHFDAPFFPTTAKEAAAMDPMKRLLFKMLSARDIYDVSHTAASATSEAMTANRVSCLYALHLACQSLKLKETEIDLVAGVNQIINPNTMHQFSAMHMLSPEGISHTFDDRTNGYGRGEGIGSLIVKRLFDALGDGDTIRAVIRGTGVNADGRTPSITQPSTLAQADLIKKTYGAPGLSQTSTQYFQIHGTAGIQRLAASYAETLQKTGLGKAGRYYLSNLAYTLSERRSHFDFRASFVASTLIELSAQLSKGMSKTKRSSRQDINLVLVFKGQGAQWPAMGQQLLSNAVFYNRMPAAYFASYITQVDAVKVAYVRGLSSATVTREGAMLATGLSRTEAVEYLAQVPPESAVIACFNGPLSVTISGDVEAIDTLETLISIDTIHNLFCKWVYSLALV